MLMLTTETGDSGQKEYAWRASKPSKSKLTTEEEKISHQLKTDFRIYFPTRETVAQSKGGIGVRLLFFQLWP